MVGLGRTCTPVTIDENTRRFWITRRTSPSCAGTAHMLEPDAAFYEPEASSRSCCTSSLCCRELSSFLGLGQHSLLIEIA